MVYSLLLTPIILSMGIIGGSYGFYKLGMWSVRKRLVNTRELLIKQQPQDDVLIEEISNHINEIDLFNSGKKKKYAIIKLNE